MPVGVYRVTGTLPIGKPLVERHKICFCSFEACGEIHLILVESEMSQTSCKPQKGISWVAVFSILLLPVITSRLVRSRVLQFDSEKRDAIDENHHINLVAGMILAVTLLTCN